jgi:hypothetical protein
MREQSPTYHIGQHRLQAFVELHVDEFSDLLGDKGLSTDSRDDATFPRAEWWARTGSRGQFNFGHAFKESGVAFSELN